MHNHNHTGLKFSLADDKLLNNFHCTMVRSCLLRLPHRLALPRVLHCKGEKKAFETVTRRLVNSDFSSFQAKMRLGNCATPALL